jgi:cytoskeleton protein RodZ
MDDGVGHELREARQRRKLGLAEVEDSTKIRARYLRAIEDEEWGQLPGDAYARAFIRTYAAFLGLDGNALAERQRQVSGTVRPGERIPHSEPVRRAPGPPRDRRAPLALAAVVAVAVFVALAVAFSGGGGGGPQKSAPKGGRAGVARLERATEVPARSQPSRLSLQLTATAEVWVCLLGAKGEVLVDGQVLSAGSVEGPFRSGSFTVSLGNGEVDMTVDGQQASIPETPSPIGFTIGSGGSMRELSEGERPTCT